METKMEGEEAASWWKSMLVETATQELELLESKFPNQFEFFKEELKSIIIPFHTHLPTSSVTTQASTNVMKKKGKSRRLSTFIDTSKVSTDVMKRKREEKSCRLSTCTDISKASTDVMERKGRSKKHTASIDTSKEDVVERKKEDDSVEVALERAKACIKKIHELKTQFLIC